MSFFNFGQKIEKVIGKEAELLEAARTGDLPTVEKILSSSSKGRKSHHVGGAIGQKLSSFLKSVNVNHTDKNGYTALHHAAVNGHRDVVEALLKADAQPGLIDNQGCTPVHLAAWKGDAEIVMQLLMAGTDSEVVDPVNIHQQNSTGDTALHCAAQYGHVAVVDVLLQKLSNPTIRNLNEASPLDLAAQYGRLEVVQRLLISHPELARHPSSTQSPLHLASRNGHRDIAEVLLDHKFDIQTMTEMGNALHEAALHGKLDVVNLLLERGIDVNQRDYRGQTVLELLSAHQAQQKSFTEITKAIQEHMRESGVQVDPGLYESLSQCRSGADKPTAAVKPLPPEKPHPSDKPCPPDKPEDKNNLADFSPDHPVPVPRVSVFHNSPEGEPGRESLVPMYSKPNKEKADMDRAISSASSTVGDAPPPLPPRTSIFTSDERHSVLPQEPSIASIPEISLTTGAKTKPKKPPRLKKSPAPVRKSPPLDTDKADTQKDTNIPEVSNIPPSETVHNDSADFENSSQQSTQCTDQSHCSGSGCDQSDSSLTHCTPPASAGQCVLSKNDENSEQNVNQESYMEMSSVKKTTQVVRPISEVKPQVKDSSTTLQAPSQTGVDNYGILFPNLKKESANMSNRPDLRRTNTAPSPEEDVYIKHSPKSPSEKFKEKQGLLRRANTAPEESTYLPMNNITRDNAVKEGTLKEPEYAEIPEKERSASPIENVYATIAESNQGNKGDKQEVETNTYSHIKELPTLPPPNVTKETKPVAADSDLTKDKTEKSAKNDNVNKEERVADTVKESKTETNKGDVLQAKTETDVEAEEKDSATDDVSEESKAENANKGSPKPTHLDFLKSKPGTPLTPTGYPQPPTPDFPPPSPATAMLGIEMKIQQIDSKRKSRDITTITDDTLESIQEQRSEVKSSEKVSEVKVTRKSSEVKVTAEIKGSTCSVDSSESSSNRSTVKSEISESAASDKELGQSAVANAVHGEVEADKGEGKESVISEQSKSIPESSIPDTVIETEEDIMSKRGPPPPIPRKPDIKPKSVKVKDQEGDSKNSTVVGGGSVHIKVTQPGNDTKDSTADVSDSTNVKVTEQGKASANTTDSGDASQGNTTTAEGGASPVVMRRKSSSSAPDMDVFKGLLRGSTVGSPYKEKSKFYNEVIRKSQAQFGEAKPLTATMEKDEDIDIDQVMESINVEVAKRASASESTTFDDSEEWEKIADIMSSFGGNLTSFTSPTHSPSEEEFNMAFEAYMDSLLEKRERGSEQMMSIGEWLESIGKGQYENNFVANGYDNIDYLDSSILEEQDLEQIGVLSHEHRQKILQATKSLPTLKPIDPDNLPPSVEEWLLSLQLPDYLETFTSHGYDTMEKVQSILWELQLRTVLDISTLGHRKRILASLGERKALDRHTPTQKKRSLSSLSPEDRSPFNNLDLYRDYTNVKPVSSSEEDIKESSQMVVDSSEDDEVFKQRKTGQSISNSDIHVRPPHMAQTSSPAKQWRHDPKMLIKGCCNYTAQYLGSTVVPELTAGTESTRAGITKLKKSTESLAKIPVIMLSISYKGVKFIDAKSKKVICDHEIGNIFCACQDTDNLNFFAYITRDIETGQHYCHVFSVKSASLAHDIILTLGESFEVAYQMALKGKSHDEAMELDRKMSHSDAEDTYSTVSKISTNTV